MTFLLTIVARFRHHLWRFWRVSMLQGQVFTFMLMPFFMLRHLCSLSYLKDELVACSSVRWLHFSGTTIFVPLFFFVSHSDIAARSLLLFTGQKLLCCSPATGFFGEILISLRPFQLRFLSPTTMKKSNSEVRGSDQPIFSYDLSLFLEIFRSLFFPLLGKNGRVFWLTCLKTEVRLRRLPDYRPSFSVKISFLFRLTFSLKTEARIFGDVIFQIPVRIFQHFSGEVIQRREVFVQQVISFY